MMRTPKSEKLIEQLTRLTKTDLNDNFWKWFGDSKVVDENGEPLVVYHGTDTEFSVFDNSVNQDKHRQIGADLGYFFTDSEKIARRFIPKRQPKEIEIDYSPFSNKEEYEYFAKNIQSNWQELKNKYGEDKFFELRDNYFEITDKINANKNQDTQYYGLKSCYLKIENPRYIDGEIIGVGEDREAFMLQSKANGNDGIIITNADTGASIATEYVVFEPNQIKSIDNKGTWLKTSDNIYEGIKMNLLDRLKALTEDLDDTLKFHDTLNPKLWNGMDLKPEVASKLDEIVGLFKEYLDIPEDAIVDVQITGSSANYNYTPYSDLDVHLIVDYDKVHEDCPLVNGYLWSMKNNFNREHDITIYDVPVELYAENANEGAVSNGIYSLKSNDWIKQPEKIEPLKDDKAVKAKYNEIQDTVDKTEDSEVARELLSKIYAMRKSGLAEGGELSTENLAFKMLRNSQAIDKLRDIIKANIDKNLSLESEDTDEPYMS